MSKAKKIFGLLMLFLLSSNLFGQENELDEQRALSFQNHFFEALKQKAIKNYDKAIQSLEKSYEIDSANYAVHFEFSKNYFLLSRFFEAHIFIDKALNKQPQNRYLLQHKVTIYKAEKAFGKAIEIQKKIVEMAPKYNDELALLYIQAGDLKTAEALIDKTEAQGLTTSKLSALKKYIVARKERKVIDKVIASDRQEEQKSSSIEDLRKKFENDKSFDVLQDLLKEELKINDFEQLQIDSKKGLDLYPMQPELYLLNGLALNQLGKYNDAIVVLNIGIDFVIDNPEKEADFFEELAKSYEGIDDSNEAEKLKQKAKELRNKI